MFSSDKSKQKKRRSVETNVSHSPTEKPIHQQGSGSRQGRSHSNLLNVPLHPLNQETKDPQKLAWVSPLDMLDYLGLGIDVLERTYIEMKMPPGEEKEFARFVNTLYFAIDAAMAILPGAGGGGLAVRASHNAGVAAWHALPASSKAHVIGEVTKQMGWSATRGSQAINVFFSVKTGKGSGQDGKSQEHQTGVGNIKDLHGKNLKWIEKQKPKGWKTVPSDNGRGWKWLDENGIERLRFTRPSGKSASASKWSREENGYFRWKDKAGNDLNIDGNTVPKTDPDFQWKTHIPYEGS